MDTDYPLTPEDTLNPTAQLEAELKRVQLIMGDLHRQRQEISVAVKQLTEKSDPVRPGPTGVAGWLCCMLISLLSCLRLYFASNLSSHNLMLWHSVSCSITMLLNRRRSNSRKEETTKLVGGNRLGLSGVKRYRRGVTAYESCICYRQHTFNFQYGTIVCQHRIRQSSR